MSEAHSLAADAVSISANAARRLNAILKSEAGAALRISVKGGGCSGFQYAFDIERSRADGRLCRHQRRRNRAGRSRLARDAEGRRARLRRRPDGPVVPGQEPECCRLVRLRGELRGLGRRAPLCRLRSLVIASCVSDRTKNIIVMFLFPWIYGLLLPFPFFASCFYFHSLDSVPPNRGFSMGYSA